MHLSLAIAAKLRHMSFQLVPVSQTFSNDQINNYLYLHTGSYIAAICVILSVGWLE